MQIAIEVDMTECQDHGQCVFAAPEIFRFGDDDRLSYEETAEVSPEKLAAVEEAVDMCPLQAIRIKRHES